MSKRLARLNEQLKREISALIRTQVRDPRVGLVTVTKVEVAGDLGSARVRVGLTGTDAEQKETLTGLKAAAPFLRHSLGQMLSIRHIPELRFLQDHSLEHALRIEQLLSEVLPEGEEGENDADGDTDGDEADGDEDDEDGPDAQAEPDE